MFEADMTRDMISDTSNGGWEDPFGRVAINGISAHEKLFTNYSFFGIPLNMPEMVFG